ncbi:MAG TPA: glycerate kinase [Candidatus Eremiobacteraceae bacterium]|nr:glycerate kinase [Candidatus Eremiobacteraceae bacterium]
MRIVIAPDKFKGSLTAREAGNAMARGLARAFPGATIDVVPVADGGDGTAQALVDALGGNFVESTVRGPDGKDVRAAYGALPDGRAVVELARASGLALVAQGKNDALQASTFGTGQLIAAALEGGCKRLILAIGGSATTDGGAGALAALGARFLDASGKEIGSGGAALTKLETIQTTELDQRLKDVEILIASDVDNPLLGRRGAAAVFAPQKGASPADVAALEGALTKFADVVERHTGARMRDVPGAGAAGGIGFGFLALAGARLQPGADLVLDAINFAGRVAGADLVITGEGRIDRQTLEGKAPYAVARAAGKRHIPAVAIAGSLDCSAADLAELGLATAMSIVVAPITLEEALVRAAPLAEDAAERLGRAIALTL